MRSPFVAALLFIATSNLLEPMMQATGQTSSVESRKPAMLDSLRDSYRPLLVFAPTDTDERFVKQAHLLASGALQLHERQVLFVPLSYRREAKSRGALFGESDLAEFPQSEAERVRNLFHVGREEFSVVLIGKDGGEKFRSHTPVTIERLNAVIDAMPMRQQEVRNGNSK